VECRPIDSSRINKYNLFVFDVVKARVASSPRYSTIHDRGDGVFVVSGRSLKYHRPFKAVNL
jgi:hypothetical protein